jgi:deazaflavin-dependent oxidoreductase (nitroreductase family)
MKPLRNAGPTQHTDRAAILTRPARTIARQVSLGEHDRTPGSQTSGKDAAKTRAREKPMTDASSAAIRDTRRDFMSDHRAMYLQSGGTEGHIMDLTAVGGHAFTTHCLIKYRGRKSGKIFITPLIYGDIGGEVVICASKGGADNHPDWYLNIADSKEVEFQIAAQAFRATWREPQGEERAKVWSFMVDNFPPYATYQASTARRIPLVMMKPAAPIDVFKTSDATGTRQFAE